MPAILLGVTGGIAAYKSVDLASRLRKGGWQVHVAMTASATRFVAPLTFEAISGRPVHLDLWSSSPSSGQEGEVGVSHIDWGRDLDVFLVAPATAHTLAKLAHGLADDVVTATALATAAPLVVAPAMNPRMWSHPATQANLATLQARGVRVIPPAEGLMACGDEGAGRLQEPAAVVDWLEAFLRQRGSLRGCRVLVSAGGTREPLDPVRYIGNRSSGRMGHALAEAAARRGAAVALVTTAPALAPSGVEVVPVETALEMQAALAARFDEVDVLIMAAAVADYRVESPETSKHKKGEGGWTLNLVKNPDILASLGARKAHQLVVGFAAETGHPEQAARTKLRSKRADYIVGNDVSIAGIGFDSDQNRVLVVGDDGVVAEWPVMPKRSLAEHLWDLFQQHHTLARFR
ncbi:MAG: bifunctional phosphopantothenoylcysteine decarboxylase/phosphopantothenate--cysteine ligase CoaBC [Candidatus Sericytochromatia bacterium]|nr:bifunctional phosphopantothenoylcysteine decarboxylase/phosphopantothenate--cysteine ligase CoaBC [Candidatus Sericytochromatia bacterium]